MTKPHKYDVESIQDRALHARFRSDAEARDYSMSVEALMSVINNYFMDEVEEALGLSRGALCAERVADVDETSAEGI